MALQKITYTDKVATEELPDVAAINKISDSDMNQIKSVVNALIDNFTTKTIIDMVYPVGSIYISKSSTNPGTLWSGTTWTAEATGRCIIGVSSSYTVGSTGGSATVNLSHTHTGPSHSHTVNSHAHSTSGHALSQSEIPGHTHTFSGTTSTDGSHIHTGTLKEVQAKNTSNSNDVVRRNGATGDYYEINIGNYAGNHTHTYSGTTSSTGNGYSHSHGDTGSSSPGTSSAGTGNTGSALSSSQSIMQPYVVMYIWRRTA